MSFSLASVPSMDAFTLAVSSFCCVAVGIIYYYYFFVASSGGKDGDEGIQNSESDPSEQSLSESDLYKHLVENPPNDDDLSSGTGNRYTWTQSESELEIFLDPGSVDEITKKDVLVVFNPERLRVRIKGEIVIDDALYAAIDPDECNWQLDRDASSKTRLWITLFKATPTAKKNFWKHILEQDRKIALSKQGPPVHRVDANDKNSIRDAMRAVSTKRS